MEPTVTNNLIAGNEFGMIWTSFGLGDQDTFNPDLAAYLAKDTLHVDIGMNNVSFSIPVTNQRHDLILLSYLQKPTTKEFFVETCTHDGVINTNRLRFMVTKLESFNVSHNVESERSNVTYAHFSVSGALEVITE